MREDGKRKVKLMVWISEELYSKIIAEAPRRYGRLRGSISMFVEEALRRFLESEAPEREKEKKKKEKGR